MHQHLEDLTHGAGINLCRVAGDDAVRFKPPDSAQARRRGESNPLGQFLIGKPTLRPEMRENCSIRIIHIPSIALSRSGEHGYASIFRLDIPILSS